MAIWSTSSWGLDGWSSSVSELEERESVDNGRGVRVPGQTRGRPAVAKGPKRAMIVAKTREYTLSGWMFYCLVRSSSWMI
jgi:hypothetical protein